MLAPENVHFSFDGPSGDPLRFLRICGLNHCVLLMYALTSNPSFVFATR